MLILANLALHGIHLAVIGFNLAGWMWVRTRRWHRLCLGVTLAFWGLGGVLIGVPGYCPLTDLHARVMTALGQEMPYSYLAWIWVRMGFDMPDKHIHDMIVGSVTVGIVVMTCLFWQQDRRRKARVHVS